jgi:hypothetical protein
MRPARGNKYLAEAGALGGRTNVGLVLHQMLSASSGSVYERFA